MAVLDLLQGVLDWDPLLMLDLVVSVVCRLDMYGSGLVGWFGFVGLCWLGSLVSFVKLDDEECIVKMVSLFGSSRIRTYILYRLLCSVKCIVVI